MVILGRTGQEVHNLQKKHQQSQLVLKTFHSLQMQLQTNRQLHLMQLQMAEHLQLKLLKLHLMEPMLELKH